MIVRDAQPADVSAVHRLIGQLADAPDEAAFRARFERVLATDDYCRRNRGRGGGRPAPVRASRPGKARH